ncbi:hypothetical protein GCM10009717_35640 [Agromyces allii]|uniref:Uncharacterized protein n=1 Tax=Agromyces allii TaxID=393607 RepID=A0ABN2R9L7_9MICO
MAESSIFSRPTATLGELEHRMHQPVLSARLRPNKAWSSLALGLGSALRGSQIQEGRETLRDLARLIK